MAYQKQFDLSGNFTGLVRIEDGARVPLDPANVDYQAYLAWVAEGNVPQEPPAPVTTWSDVQAKARVLLDDSDQTILRCYEHAVVVPSEWQTYRAALRAIISAATGDATQALPTKPAYPAGT
jgi:hypothetical protein